MRTVSEANWGNKNLRRPVTFFCGCFLVTRHRDGRRGVRGLLTHGHRYTAPKRQMQKKFDKAEFRSISLLEWCASAQSAGKRVSPGCYIYPRNAAQLPETCLARPLKHELLLSRQADRYSPAQSASLVPTGRPTLHRVPSRGACDAYYIYILCHHRLPSPR